MPHIIGCDPGLDGAIVSNLNGALGAWDMPTFDVTVNGKKRRRIDVYQFSHILTMLSPVDMVILEEPSVRPGESGSSALQIGRGWGQLYGVLVALERPVTLVTSQKWTKALGAGSDKDAHREMAMRLFPASSDLFSRKRDDGRADAALLTHWWLRQ